MATNTNNPYRLLVIIPVYNHHRKIAAMLATINHSHLPCLLLDDGSDHETQLALELAVNHSNANLQRPQNILRRFPRNRGKGAVVCDGIRFAKQHGYTHVLQVDADGQHNLGDLPPFISMSQAHPQDIISGARAYDSMPAKRRYGRMVTDVWVHINTLSRDIQDSMCGYRLYPVASTFTLVETNTIGRRMDFDTDILVRSYWAGRQVHHIPTSVQYEPDNVSHFDLLADNLRISRMHAILFFGMLWHLPRLLSRKFSAAAHKQPATQA